MHYLLFVLAILSFSLKADITHYDPVSLANRFSEQLHPREDRRDMEYLESLIRAGRNLACGAAVAAYANNELSKGFHNAIIGGAYVTLKLLPNLPKEIRHGLFSNEIGPSLGIASFTTGRSDSNPFHLKPDVTGLTVGLVVNGKWVVLTATASQGAFSKTLEDFSELSSLSARGASFLGVLRRSRLRENLYALQDPEDISYRRYFSLDFPLNPRRVAMAAGGALGEGLFMVKHPIAGLGSLLPAVLSGRRSPFPGYQDIGYGSGHAYLLTENCDLGDRTAFRFGFRLADTYANRKLRDSIPSWLGTLSRATLGGDSQYLSTEFEKWNQAGDIEYEMYIQLEDKENPDATSIEHPYLRWKSEKIPVAVLTLHQKSKNEFIHAHLLRLLRIMPFNPGFGFHMPLGNLGYGRAVGPVVGKDLRASKQAVGAYWQSAVTRQAIGFSDTGIDAELLAEYMKMINSLARPIP